MSPGVCVRERVHAPHLSPPPATAPPRPTHPCLPTPGEGQLTDVREAVAESIGGGQPWQVLVSQTIMSQASDGEGGWCGWVGGVCVWVGGVGWGGVGWGGVGGTGAFALRSSCPTACTRRRPHHRTHTTRPLPPPLQIRAPRLRETLPLQPWPLRSLCRGALGVATDEGKAGKEGAEMARMYVGMGSYGVVSRGGGKQRVSRVCGWGGVGGWAAWRRQGVCVVVVVFTKGGQWVV